MNKALMAGIVILALAPAAAVAQERAGDAALGAVSGAVVLGPIGAVAGALVGYTAGPSISRSWGLHGSRSARSRRYQRDPNRAANAAPRTAEAMNANGQLRPASNPPAPPPPAAPVQTSAPPVQGFE
jgi:hypothetical protein